MADLAFAVHAGILSVLTLSQFSSRIWGWRSREQGFKLEARPVKWPTLLTRCLIAGAGLFIASSITVVLASKQHAWQWLDLVERPREKITSFEIRIDD